MHIELSPSCQEDIGTTIATTNISTLQLNSTTTIDIHEPTSLCGTFVKNESSAHDTNAASTVIIDMGEDEEAVVSSVTALLPSNNKVVLGIQNRSQ